VEQEPGQDPDLRVTTAYSVRTERRDDIIVTSLPKVILLEFVRVRTVYQRRRTPSNTTQPCHKIAGTRYMIMLALYVYPIPRWGWLFRYTHHEVRYAVY